MIVLLSTLALAQTYPRVAAESLDFYHYHVEELEYVRTLSTVSYQMSQRTADGADYTSGAVYSDLDVFGGWGKHALQWKHQHAPTFGVDLSINPTYANDVACDDVSPLNAAESTSAPVAFWSVSGPVDPAGDWMCESITDAATAVVYAAFVMDKWSSPVYTPWYTDDSAYGGTSSHREGAWQQLTFSFPGGGDLYSYCGVSSTDSASTVLSAVMNGNCSTSGIVLNTAEISSWADLITGSGQQYFYPDYSVPGAHLFSVYNYSQSSGDLVFDPPADAAEDAYSLLRAAEVIATHLLVEDPDSGILVPLAELLEGEEGEEDPEDIEEEESYQEALERR